MGMKMMVFLVLDRVAVHRKTHRDYAASIELSLWLREGIVKGCAWFLVKVHSNPNHSLISISIDLIA